MALRKKMTLDSFKALVNTTWDGNFESNAFRREQDIKRNTVEIWQSYWICQIYTFSLPLTGMVISNGFKRYWRNVLFVRNS